MSLEGIDAMNASAGTHLAWEGGSKSLVEGHPESAPGTIAQVADVHVEIAKAGVEEGGPDHRDKWGAEESLPFSEEPVTLVDPEALPALGEAARARGYLWIQLDAPGPAHRGRLGLFIEETIENALEDRGGLAPGVIASTGLDASVSDQLYRARLIEMRGIALGIPSLEGITNLGRTLDADDSSVLRWWMAAAADRPIRLLISKANTRLRVYQAPVFFEALFELSPSPLSPRAPSVEMAESSGTMDLSDLPPAVTLDAAIPSQVDSHDSLGQGRLVRTDDGVTDVEEDYLLSERRVALVDLDRALGLPSVLEAPQPAEIAHPAEPVALPADDQQLSAPVAAYHEPSSQQSNDELDSEQFLRTLAEDSARAPAVAAEEELSSVASVDHDGSNVPAEDVITQSEADSECAPITESTPSEQPGESVAPEEPPVVAAARDSIPREPVPELPTKAIARKPFIRFATASETVHEAPSKPDLETSKQETQASPSEDPHGDDAGRAVGEEPSVVRPALDPEDPFNQLAARKWQSWVSNLVAARGPKPLSVIERMFVTDYTRLREAVRRGVADPSANEVLDEWRDAFTSSYGEAYDALRVRGKRPTMVLDLPELAKRLGRLQGAKRVQLFLVDGMRFDLGIMIQERLRKCAAAALTERLLLWSALPSVTSHQLELLGRGPDGLKDRPVLDESPALVARGRAALTPRRVRTGTLEILKLDVVEDMLRQPGLPVLDRLEGIADAAAEAIAAHIEKLPERTMVVVFGDHGFALDPQAVGTTEEVKQGGASPEEVLVPAFAWLTGATH